MSKNYSKHEKFKIGCQAVGGKPVKDISGESGMSREYVYQQKEKVELFSLCLDEAKPENEVIEIDAKLKERTILSLSLDCSASLEGIQRFFESVYRTKISIGYISGVIKKSGGKSPED